jgi:hypothetical protein
MKRVVASEIVSQPPARVWELYADVSGSADWIPFVEEVLYMSGPAGLGQSYGERTRFMGMSSVSDWRIVEWDPLRRQVHRSTSTLMDMDLVIEIEAISDGSRVRQEALLHSKMPLLGRAHEAVFGFVAGSGLKSAVAAAKLRLERADARGRNPSTSLDRAECGRDGLDLD